MLSVDTGCQKYWAGTKYWTGTQRLPDQLLENRSGVEMGNLTQKVARSLPANPVTPHRSSQ
jgi:hypothetical protein